MAEGYARMASLIGQKPEVAIFRRFGNLNAENLLYLQAEIAILEVDLRDIVEEDRQSDDPNRRKYATSWWHLKQSSKHGDMHQWNKRNEIREKLREYNRALLDLSLLHSLSPPDPGDLQFLRDWLANPEGAKGFLDGPEDNVWRDQNKHDLLALRSRPGERDLFTRWVTGPVLDWLHRVFLYRYMESRAEHVWFPQTKSVDYDDERLLQIADNLSTVVASSFPVVSVIILYFIKRTLVRLYVIIVFITIFALGLTIFTKAKRIEVFTATATFAAVQVVFISTGAPT